MKKFLVAVALFALVGIPSIGHAQTATATYRTENGEVQQRTDLTAEVGIPQLMLNARRTQYTNLIDLQAGAVASVKVGVVGLQAFGDYTPNAKILPAYNYGANASFTVGEFQNEVGAEYENYVKGQTLGTSYAFFKKGTGLNRVKAHDKISFTDQGTTVAVEGGGSTVAGTYYGRGSIAHSVVGLTTATVYAQSGHDLMDITHVVAAQSEAGVQVSAPITKDVNVAVGYAYGKKAGKTYHAPSLGLALMF